MTIDVPLVTDIQDACQFGPMESGSEIKAFSTSSNLPDDAARAPPADFLATPMISCAAQHSQPPRR
ncbi:hypothetical protein [Bradyrhizobium sp. CCBAU 51753]|uniref:hypothetical protein n=1 Tax=Bradyrhizobium sp. CCBAU 51753 TaxID=1325100 RepID=UPI00188A1F4A|nr:hypothetical protein [Bradyrhizobium sp. CCBAU 51753]